MGQASWDVGRLWKKNNATPPSKRSASSKTTAEGAEANSSKVKAEARRPASSKGSTESTDVKKPRQQAGQGRTQTKAHANLPFGNRKARNTNQDEEIGVKKEKQRK
eukprot:1159290-Pelagomonas_calceolata.AAC.6